MDITFEPLRETDLPTLAAWLARPRVETWWREPSDLTSVAARYRPLLNGLDPTEGFLVLLDGRPIGFAQRYRIDDDLDWSFAVASALGDSSGVGIDYLIGEVEFTGRGFGRIMISAFVAGCWRRYPEAGRLVVSVQQGNIASYKALEACGFARVWSGELDTRDPSDQGASFLYVLCRPAS